MAFAAIIKKKFLNVQHSIGLRMRSIQQQRIRLEEPDGGESCTEFYLNNAAPLCVLLIVCEGEPAAALASSPRSMNVQHSELLSRTQTQNIAREKPVAARSAAVKPTNGSCAETSFRVRWKKQQRQNLKGKVERQLPFEPQPPPPPITPLVRVWRVAFCMRRDPTPDDAPLLSSQQLPNPDHPSIRNPPCICRMHRTDLLHVMNIGCEFVLLLVRLCSPPRPHRVLPLLGWRLSRGGINCPLIAPLSVQLLPKAEKRSGSFSDLPKRKLSFRRALFRLLPVFAVCLATVTVSVIPRKEVLRGETIRLPCNYTTSAAASTIVVQWFIELADGSRKQVAFKSSQGLDAGTVSERYTIGNDMSLSITQVTADDHKKFICQVTAGAVGTSDAATQVKVFSAPEKPVVEGNNQNIFVSHKTSPPSEVGKCISRNGHPEPRIIWFKDDTPLPEEKKTTEKTYMLPFLVKEASGLYTMTSTLYMQLIKADAKSVFHCTVEYSMPNNQIKQESSDRFNLSLHYSAENVFFKVKTQGPIKEGDDVEMLCETDGNPQPEFDFMKDENQLTGSRGTLTVKGVSRSDAGIYQCEALDFDAVDVELTKNVNLNVHYIDAMSVTPSGALNASRGDSDSKVLSNNGGLRIESVTLSDGGVYVCAGDVPSVPGLKKQANVILTVIGHPEIDAPVHGSVDKEGRMVSLNCSALGYPAPQFIWKPSGKESVTVSGTRVISTVTLEATAAVLKDGVICEAYNTLGRDSKNFKVSIKQDAEKVNADNTANRAEKQQGGSSSVVIAVVKGKLNCGKKDTKEVASGGAKDNIVVEMKSSEKSKEEAGLLKPADQGVEYTRVVVLNVGMVFLRDAALKRTVQHPTDICSELTPSAKTKLRETLDRFSSAPHNALSDSQECTRAFPPFLLLKGSSIKHCLITCASILFPWDDIQYVPLEPSGKSSAFGAVVEVERHGSVCPQATVSAQHSFKIIDNSRDSILSAPSVSIHKQLVFEVTGHWEARVQESWEMFAGSGAVNDSDLKEILEFCSCSFTISDRLHAHDTFNPPLLTPVTEFAEPAGPETSEPVLFEEETVAQPNTSIS
ncbi:hypothetical protein DNTS_014254, partial [Danionella cerebrum]